MSENETSEGQLLAAIRQFEKLANDCPASVNARQRVMTRRGNGFVFVQIVTSFKVTVDNEAPRR